MEFYLSRSSERLSRKKIKAANNSEIPKEKIQKICHCLILIKMKRKINSFPDA